jgi:hypothetical protein
MDEEIESIARRIEYGMATAEDAALLRTYWETRSQRHEQVDHNASTRFSDQRNQSC